MKTGKRLILNGDDGAGGVIDADCYSSWFKPKNGTIHVTYKFNKAGVGNANLVAVLKLQVRNGDVVGEVDCTDDSGTLIAFPSNPAGSLMSDEVGFKDMNGFEYRIWVDVTSGDGSGEAEACQ
jgi:hypothetical protein